MTALGRIQPFLPRGTFQASIALCETLDRRRRFVQSSAEVVSPGDNLRQKPKSLSQVSVVIGFDGLGRKSDQIR